MLHKKLVLNNIIYQSSVIRTKILTPIMPNILIDDLDKNRIA